MPYPYVPKSNKSLSKGDYWIIKLEGDKFAIGIVVDVPPLEKKSTREFIAGLLDWSGSEPPTADDFKNRKIIDQGVAHIKSIVYTGGEIAGNIDLQANHIELLVERNQIRYHPQAWILKGYEKVRNMERDDLEMYSVRSYWGYDAIKVLAEKLLGSKD